jgi:phosphatidylserine/phosphatidylglycerophosphate/cardiolipin synthase-like enzyme
MQSIEIYLPCQVFAVQARFGLSDSLSALDILLLRAIHAGEHSVEQLGRMFGLPDKMLRDALIGMWHAGHLVFASLGKKLYLSQDTGKLIEEKRFDELQGAASGFEEIDLMFDLVTGRVLPLAGRTTPPNTAAIMPYVPNTIKLENLASDAIVAALEKLHRGPAAQKNGTRLLSAAIAFQANPSAPRIRWRRLEVRCYRKPDGKHEVTVLSTTPLPYGCRREIGEYLTRLVDEEHEGTDKHFFERLHNNAMQGTPSRFGLGEEIRRLADAAKNLSSCPSDKAIEQHYAMVDQADPVAVAVAEEISSLAKFTPIVGIEAHETVIRNLISRAKEQVVIACPFVSGDGLARLLSSIRQALGNRARVIILWGISRRPTDGTDPYDELHQEVKNIVEDLRMRYPNKFIFSQRASGIHAKVLVRDHEAVLVTSLNLLQPSRDGVTEIGVLVERHEEGPDSLSISSDILNWAREIVPDTAVTSAITVGQKRLLSVPRMPNPPPAPREDQTIQERRLDVAVWASQWIWYTEQLSRLRGVKPSVRLVRDQQHRGLLELGMTSATKRLVVTSDQVSSDAVRASTRNSLFNLSKTAIRIVYRDPARIKTAEGLAAEQLLHKLQDEAKVAGHDLQCLRTNNHSKVLIFDDTAVVSSFNFLSHSGQYRGVRTAEVGLLLNGPGVADTLASAVIQAFPGLRPIPQFSPEISILTPVERDRDTTAVLEHLDSTGPGLQDVFASVAEPWGLLASITELPTISSNAAIIRRLAAACMAAKGRESNPVEFQRWAEFLARQAWVNGDAIEAYLLLSAGSETVNEYTSLPHLTVIAIAAKRLANHKEYYWSNIQLNDIPGGQQTALAVIAIEDAIERASREAAEFAELVHLSGYLPPAWERLLQNVHEYHEVAFEPFPHQVLANEGEDQHERRFEREFRALERVLENNLRKRFTSGLAGKTWSYLFGEAGTLGQLHVAVRDRSNAGIHAWFDSLDSRNPSDMLRNAIHMIGESRELEEDKREPIENSLRTILDAAATVERISRWTRYDYTAQTTNAARKLCEELSALWPSLVDEASSAVDQSAQRVTDHVLTDLKRLTMYAKP